MANEFVMLAHKFDPVIHIGCWFLSEKLDGMRCIWDGGITRGVPKAEVPWANTAKDGRYRNQQVATGLWTRLGNVIHAPDWWLDSLPPIALDGELYSHDISRQLLFSIIKDQIPGPSWDRVQYHVFDLIPLQSWLMDRRINNTGFKKTLSGCVEWAAKRRGCRTGFIQFQTVVELLKCEVPENAVVRIHPQTWLPGPYPEAMAVVEERCNQILEAGGEGVILRNPTSYWTPERTHNLLKYKPTDDAEGTVIGYISGRSTEKGSKLLGMMGALILKLDTGQRLELSGFTDEERELQRNIDAPEIGISCTPYQWAAEHPGQELPAWIEATHFPRGTRVTFRYRGLSDAGIPMEARYFRKRVD